VGDCRNLKPPCTRGRNVTNATVLALKLYTILIQDSVTGISK
jgi:hypothetical protein